MLQELRELKYEPDYEFLLNISSIDISFSKTDALLQNLPFCYTYQKFINKKKNKYVEERFILFTTLFQLKELRNVEHIYMDGTFKYCPKNFYQIYNIIGIEKDNGNKIPLMYILMSSKSYQLYIYI